MRKKIIIPVSQNSEGPERLILTEEQLAAQQRLHALVNNILKTEQAIFAGNFYAYGMYKIMGKRTNPEPNQTELFLMLTSPIPYHT